MYGTWKLVCKNNPVVFSLVHHHLPGWTARVEADEEIGGFFKR